MQGKLLKTFLSIEVLYTALKNSWMKPAPSKPEPIFVDVKYGVLCLVCSPLFTCCILAPNSQDRLSILKCL